MNKMSNLIRVISSSVIPAWAPTESREGIHTNSLYRSRIKPCLPAGRYGMTLLSSWVRTFNFLLVFLTFAFCLLTFPKPTFAATVTWDGGASGSWNTATNWSNDIVPTSSDDVTIDNAAVTTSSNISFSTLTIGSGTNTTSLTLTNNITSGGSITINNAGTLTQNNKVQQTITGTLTINSGGNLTHTANSATNLYNVNGSSNGNISIPDFNY